VPQKKTANNEEDPSDNVETDTKVKGDAYKHEANNESLQ